MVYTPFALLTREERGISGKGKSLLLFHRFFLKTENDLIESIIIIFLNSAYLESSFSFYCFTLWSI